MIPRPRKKLVNYYGVFAPAAGLRDYIVPGPAGDHEPDEAEAPAPDDAIRRLGIGSKPPAAVPHAPSRLAPRKAYTWADLMRRVFLIEVMTCPHCQGPRRLLAAVFDPEAIEQILRCLGLPLDAPAIAAARPPPHQRLPW
ncbi:MAG: hypothetical protein ABFS46_14705 [Myxococcota bacterium]